MQERAKKRIFQARRRRKLRVRRKLHGSAERPRLSVNRSLKSIYAQLVDDEKGQTLTEASSLSPELKKSLKGKESKLEIGKQVGLLLAQRASEKGIKKIVFDRGCYLYHGRIKALAEGAREGGLEF